MLKSSNTIRSAWATLPAPSAGRGRRAVRVERRNAWVVRDASGAFGVLLHGVRPPVGAPRLRHIKIRYRPLLILHTEEGQSELQRCVEVLLDPQGDEGTVVRVLERLEEEKPAGDYSTNDLIETIVTVMETFRKERPAPPMEEVVGAWGELFFLYLLSQNATGAAHRIRLLQSWEAEGRERDIIDFRFLFASTAIEVKTTTGARRHHIHGTRQVTVPDDCSSGYLASIAVRPADQGGLTCQDILDRLYEAAAGDAEQKRRLQEVLDAKIAQRGRACEDSEHRFVQAEGGLRFLEMAEVPRPVLVPGVEDVQWVADLRDMAWMDARHADTMIESIATASGA